MPRLKIGDRWIGDDEPTYFIADISANHDGDLERAKALIHLAAEAGADAAKFQNFRAAHIVSDLGFRTLGGGLSHQAGWRKSVYEVYQDASLPWEWTEVLKAEADSASIAYFSTPYDFEAVDYLDPYVPAFKIGSGDITWTEMLQKVATKGKPMLLATGASTIGDVQRAVHAIQRANPQLVLMQCNTNYTASPENFKHVHLRTLHTYRLMFSDTVLGLSDHTSGHAAVLGAIALGARVVEKHFTDDCGREGPDHPFSMTPQSWRDMVLRSRELEYALGSSDKQVEANEQETVIVQRRCVRAGCDLAAGTLVNKEHIEVLRPAPLDAIFPHEIENVIGCKLRVNVAAGQYLRWTMFDSVDGA